MEPYGLNTLSMHTNVDILVSVVPCMRVTTPTLVMLKRRMMNGAGFAFLCSHQARFDKRITSFKKYHTHLGNVVEGDLS